MEFLADSWTQIVEWLSYSGRILPALLRGGQITVWHLPMLLYSVISAALVIVSLSSIIYQRPSDSLLKNKPATKNLQGEAIHLTWDNSHMLNDSTDQFKASISH